jgi:tetratricopeptide (TPR) repeat protein
MPYSWGYWNYSNPYWDSSYASSYIDYSQPIVVASAPEQPIVVQTPPAQVNVQVTDAAAQPAQPLPLTPQDEAAELLDQAREEFRSGDYATALDQVGKAIAKLPNDALLHEFRSLCLFALKRYKESAATIYAVLSVGPGWDWTTLSSMYPSLDTYTQQLRDLENYRRDHPREPEARLLLAYHYITQGHNESAAAELQAVVQLNPQDQLAVQLLKSVKGEEEPPAAAPATPAPSQPVTAAALAGQWKASQPGGASIALNLTPDSKFTWRYTHQGKTDEFAGPYKLADNLLILEQQGGAPMIGEVALASNNRLNFKLSGASPSDPGLTFSK